MFYIDQSLPSFDLAKNEHFSNVRYIIKKKLLGELFTEPAPKGCIHRISKLKLVEPDVFAFLDDEINLKKVIIGLPVVLDGIKDKFKDEKSIKCLKTVFKYDAFISKDKKGAFHFYNAYHLANNLRQDVCVYCNRLYTNTVITKKGDYVARPTFDHWLPKAKYPLFGLSFFNLVPSCSICNTSIKGSDAYSISSIFHPYSKNDDVNEQLEFRFSFTLADAFAAESKIIADNEFTERSIRAMKLREIYSAHTEEIRDLIYLKKAYSEAYLDSLRILLKSPLSTSEIYRLAFGSYHEDELLHKRPLSKLKRDILKELGIIA